MERPASVRTCETCHREFLYKEKSGREGNPRFGRFCSVKCRWDIRKVTARCETCGADYVYYPANKYRQYLSRFCSGFCSRGGTIEQRFRKQFALGVINETGCILCPLYKGEKYSRIASGKAGSQKFMHRVAYELKHGPIPDGLHVLHRCDNPACANVDHLFLGTPAENMADKVKSRQLKGSGHPEAKLTERSVLEIRSKYAHVRGVLTQLANEYGVRKQAIMKIVKRQSWRHI